MGNTFFHKYKEIIGLAIILFIFIIWGIIRRDTVQEGGIFTIAKIVKYESDASGSSLYLEVYFQGEKINTVVNSSCLECGRNHHFYFVKVLKQNPKFDIYFMEDFPVPECILKEKIPSEGWKEIPNCK